MAGPGPTKRYGGQHAISIGFKINGIFIADDIVQVIGMVGCFIQGICIIYCTPGAEFFEVFTMYGQSLHLDCITYYILLERQFLCM